MPKNAGLIPLSLLFLLSVASSAPAQPPASELPEGQDVELLLEQANVRARIRLALPPAKRSAGLSREATTAADTLEATLLADLLYSRVFEVQDSEILSVLELNGDRQNDFLQYRSLGNQAVLLAELKEEGGRLTLEARVHDLQNYREIGEGKRYRGRYEQARKVAHTYADRVVEAFTGRRGIALTQIVFTSDRTGHKELYMMDYDGHNQRAISGHKSFTLAPHWGATGDGIVYVSYFSRHPSIYYVELETGAKKTVLEDGFHNFSPNLSPDGRQVVLTRSLSGNSEIFTVPRAGGDPKRVTNHPRIDANPAWSPTGREIAFTSDRAGTPQIYVMDRAGGNLRRVTREGTNNDGAAWHPDGTRLAYAHRHKNGNRFDIAIIDLITLENKILTSGPGSHENPSFSPDGERIIFESSRNGSWQVWAIDVDGYGQRRLTSQGESYSPSWSSYIE